MITRIEALNFRCLRYVSQPMDKFHVLVGPNGSGKSSFLDVIGFVSRFFNDGLESAFFGRFPTDTIDPVDVLHNRQGEGFELAIETSAPLRDSPGGIQKRFRYELSIGVNSDTSPFVRAERLSLLSNEDQHQEVFDASEPPRTLMRGRGRTIMDASHNKALISYFPDSDLDDNAVHFPFHRSFSKSAMPAYRFLDAEDFSGGIWCEQFMSQSVQRIDLISQELRRPSPRKRERFLRDDGSSLPWLVYRIENTLWYSDWISHLQTAIPEVKGVRTILREEDAHRYIKVQYMNGLELPQWVVSDGTLRLIALTLPAFVSATQGILLVEEPENGIHPKAIETAYQALSTVDSTQVLLTTHSPIVLNIAEPRNILCFSKDKSGAVQIVRGDDHPTLEGWQHEVSLGTLFAAGALE